MEKLFLKFLGSCDKARFLRFFKDLIKTRVMLEKLHKMNFVLQQEQYST